jgi:hypothetical protein
MKTSQLDSKINSLKNGQFFRVGGSSQVWTTCEKSGDGKTIRFVRHTPNTSEVFKSVRA